MAQSPITVKLPGCGGEAVIRGFVKNKDRKAIQRISLEGTEVSPEDVKDDKVTLKLRGENMLRVNEEQVRRLLISYNGDADTPYDTMMDSEYEEDMEAVEQAVQKVFGEGGDADANAKKSKSSASSTTAS